MDYRLLTDEILVKLLKADDEIAYEEVYTRYWKNLFNAAYYRIGSKEAAKEIVQNLFLYIWEKRNSLAITNLEGYFKTAIKNRVINYIDSKFVHKKYQQQFSNNFDGNSAETEAAVYYNELYHAFEKALKSLPPKTRDVFTMSRVEQLSIKEIACRLGISEKAVEYHITSSLKMLRISLKDYMIGCFLIAAIISI